MTEDIWKKIPSHINTITLKTLAGDTSLVVLASLLEEFNEELLSLQKQAEAYRKSGDPSKLSLNIHTIKGLAATFGALGLHKNSLDLESTLSNTNGPEAGANFANLMASIDQTIVDTDTILALLKETNG